MYRVDFHSATVFRTLPIFPYRQPDPTTPSLPEELLAEAACSSPTSLLNLSVAGVDCFNWFYRLHRLGLATSIQWGNLVDRVPLANMLYEAEYALLSMPDRSEDFLIPDRARRDGRWDDSDDATANAASVVEALIAASQIFLYAALREVPVRAKVFDHLLGRLKATVDRSYVNVVEVWEAERNLHMLLWVLVVGAAVAKGWGGSSWWVEHIVEVVERLQLDGKEAFTAMLKSAAWTDVFFEPVSEDLWNDVMTVREQDRVQELIDEERIGGDGNGGTEENGEPKDYILTYAEMLDMPILLKAGEFYEGGYVAETDWNSLGGYLL